MRRPAFPPDRPAKTPASPENGAADGWRALHEVGSPAPPDAPQPPEGDPPPPATPEHTLSDRPGRQGTWAGRWRTLSRLPVTLMIASVLLGLGIVQLTFHLGHTLYRSVTWTQETRQTLARVQALQRDVNILHDAEKAATDPAYLEQLARCQGYVGREEQVIVAQNAPTTPGENCEVIRLP